MFGFEPGAAADIQRELNAEAVKPAARDLVNDRRVSSGMEILALRASILGEYKMGRRAASVPRTEEKLPCRAKTAATQV
jgi:hypothetical protein